jgi:four helix bundle suffix protein
VSTVLGEGLIPRIKNGSFLRVAITKPSSPSRKLKSSTTSPFRFAHKFLSKGDRTIDQMIQAARSGKKNLLEGSKAGITSRETELKLTNVARASLEELLDDYRDYLRVRDLPQWDKDSKQGQYVRKLGRKTPPSFEDYREFVETRPPEVIANIAICLIHQANYLIDQQLRRLERDFLAHGGLRERMTRMRLSARKKA